MLNPVDTFEQTREYMKVLECAVNCAPSNFGDDAFLGSLHGPHSEAQRRFCNLEVHTVAQAVAQLRVAIGEDDIDHVGLTGVSVSRIIDRIEELAGLAPHQPATGSADCPRGGRAAATGRRRHPLDEMWEGLQEEYSVDLDEEARDKVAAKVLALPARNINDCIMKLIVAGIDDAAARAGGSFTAIVNEMTERLDEQSSRGFVAQ